MKLQAPTYRWLAADIEPGRSYGDSRPAIGLCEVWDSGTVGEALQFPMTSASGITELWPFVSAYVADSPLIFFNRAYDRAALRKWLTRYGIVPPPMPASCSLVAARQTLGRAATAPLAEMCNSLNLFTDDEREERRSDWLHRGIRMGRPNLRNAADDALACARLVRYLTVRTSQTVSDLFARQDARSLNDSPH